MTLWHLFNFLFHVMDLSPVFKMLGTKGIFPSGNFPSLSSPQRSAPHCSLRRLWREVLEERENASGKKPNVWEGVTCEIGHLGRCFLGNWTFGKVSLGKLDIWEGATWSPLGKNFFFLKECRLETNATV